MKEIYTSQTTALNKALILSGIEITISRANENSDWEAEINTKKHDQVIVAETIDRLIREIKAKFPTDDIALYKITRVSEQIKNEFNF